MYSFTLPSHFFSFFFLPLFRIQINCQIMGQKELRIFDFLTNYNIFVDIYIRQQPELPCEINKIKWVVRSYNDTIRSARIWKVKQSYLKFSIRNGSTKKIKINSGGLCSSFRNWFEGLEMFLVCLLKIFIAIISQEFTLIIVQLSIEYSYIV